MLVEHRGMDDTKGKSSFGNLRRASPGDEVFQEDDGDEGNAFTQDDE